MKHSRNLIVTDPIAALTSTCLYDDDDESLCQLGVLISIALAAT